MIIKKIFNAIALFLLLCILLVSAVLLIFRLVSVLRESKTNIEAAPSSGRFVPAGDIEMYIEEMGDPGDPAVIFIHGTGAWSGTWRETMTAVAREGFYALAIDMPPFGYSERPSDPSYTRMDQAERVIGLMDELGVSQATLVGHSYGGGATVETAFRASEKVKALVLVDPALALEAVPAESLMLNSLLKVPLLRDSLLATTISNPLFTRTLLKFFIFDPVDVTDEWVEIYQRPMNVRGATASVGQWLPTLLLPPPVSLSTEIESYRNFKIPTVLIWGELDSITPLSQGIYLAENMPAAQLKTLSGVGHIPQIEDPQAFQEVLIDFLLEHK